MIPNSLPATHHQQLTRFLEAPTPKSLMEPGFGRACDTHRVGAVRQEDGTFVLFARSPTHRTGKTLPMGDLDAFLDGVVQEVKAARGDGVCDAVDALRQSIHRWRQTGQAPTVFELRSLNARLSAPPPSAIQLHARATARARQFQQALQKSLDALPEKDPQRGALEKAGDALTDMLFAPNETLSLEGLSHHTIGLLLDTGLLARFAELRDGVKPAPKRLVLSASAPSVLERLPPLFPAVSSWIVRSR